MPDPTLFNLSTKPHNRGIYKISFTGTKHVLQNSFNKYSESRIRFTHLRTCHVDDLLRFEQHYMDTLKPNLNLRPVAGSQLGFRHSEESRRQMSLSKKGKPSGRIVTEELRNKIRLPQIGRKLTEQHVRNLIAGKQNISQETRERNRRAAMGNKARARPVYRIGLDGNIIATHKSKRDAMAFLRTSCSTGLDRCLKGLRTKFRGYRWQFVNNEKTVSNGK
jgi:group I intron endonuclease